jgi:hypothetical protein
MFWVGLGVFIAVGSYKLGLGRFTKPGPGLLPFILGIILSICSIPILIGSLHTIITAKTKRENEGIWKGVNLKKIGLVVACLIAYAILLEKIGYILTTSIVFFFLFKIANSQKWQTILIISFLLASISYLIFYVLLQVQLPPDPWRVLQRWV